MSLYVMMCKCTGKKVCAYKYWGLYARILLNIHFVITRRIVINGDKFTLFMHLLVAINVLRDCFYRQDSICTCMNLCVSID